MNKIYVFHEYGSPSHYNGLVYLCNSRGLELVFREIRLLHLIGSGIKHRKYRRISKQILNFLFLMNLLFTKNKKIILALCPYNWRLLFLIPFLRNHKIYFHSSYTFWNPTSSNLYSENSLLFKVWKKFLLESVCEIYSVTEETKNQIVKYIKYPQEHIHVVFHSFKETLHVPSRNKTNRFLYVGRMDKQKGIEELCECFKKRKDLHLTLIGTGELDKELNNINVVSENIEFLGYIKGLSNLSHYYYSSSYFILNSKRISKWEELFGQVLIEAMACGCIPIAVDHTGPHEIIDNLKNGYLFEEGKINDVLDNIRTISNTQYQEVKINAIKKGQSYHCSVISERWDSIL